MAAAAIIRIAAAVAAGDAVARRLQGCMPVKGRLGVALVPMVDPAAMRAVDTHLTPAVRKRLGAPDVRLVVGGAAFPAHSTLLALNAGVLASLLKG